MSNPKNFLVAVGVALVLYLGATASAVAGTCVISGQGLVTAFALAEQEGYRSFGVGIRKKGNRRHGKIYTVPGRLGVKGRAKSGVLKAAGYFFKPHRTTQRLKGGWKITDVRYGGTPTAVGHKILNGTYVYLYTRDFLTNFQTYDFYITSFTLTHPQPGRKCGNDPISQQIVLRRAFKG